MGKTPVLMAVKKYSKKLEYLIERCNHYGYRKREVYLQKVRGLFLEGNQENELQRGNIMGRMGSEKF